MRLKDTPQSGRIQEGKSKQRSIPTREVTRRVKCSLARSGCCLSRIPIWYRASSFRSVISLPASKRSRARDACHSIKIKCELGSSGRDPPCSRCLRLGKKCFVSVPKSQKDKVAELEARVEFLTKTTESLRTSDVPTPPIEESSNAPSTRKPHDQKVVEIKEPAARCTSIRNQLCSLDTVIALPLQKTLHQKYVCEMSSRFELLPLPSPHDFDTLRLQRPLLLLAVMYAASDGVLHFDQHEHLGKILLDLIVPFAGSETAKSLELVQVILITCLWYRLPTYHTKVTPQQLIQLAVNVTTDIGITNTEEAPLADLSRTNQSVSGAEARIALVVCRMLSSSIFIFLRTGPPISWSAHDDLALFMLESPTVDHEKTRLVAQYARAERLCAHIATRLEFSNFGKPMDMGESETKFTMRSLQNMILDWKAQIPPQLFCPALKLWEHATMLYLHELVLHTPGNKQTFTAPFTAERLSVTDFPKPVVTQDHIGSLIVLRNNAHALIDLFSTLESDTIMSLPAILFASRVAYSVYILVKLYVATTARGNTFGTFVDPDSIMLDEYLHQAIEIRNIVHSIDSRCGTAKILGMSLRLKEWSENYRNTNLLNGMHIQHGLHRATFDYDWNSVNAGFDVFAPGETGFVDSFSDFDLSTTQSWAS